MKKAAITVGLVFVWAFQYTIGALAVGVWKICSTLPAVILIFIPIIGWIVLYVLHRNRVKERHHAELVHAVRGTEPEGRSIWRPWGIDLIRAPAPQP